MPSEPPSDRLSSIEKKFVAFLRGLSPAERRTVLPAMESWIALMERTGEETSARAATSSDMDTYAALRQARQRGL